MNSLVLVILVVLMFGVGVVTGYMLSYSVANTTISNQCNKFVAEHCYCSGDTGYNLPIYLPNFNLS
jgi:hypothetical protein